MPAECGKVHIGIREFDIKKSLKPDRIILLVGKRGTGKSTLLKDILSYVYREFDAGCGMSPTPDSTDMMREFMPDSVIYEDYNEDKIKEIIRDVDLMNKRGDFPRIFILLDDCMFDQKILKSTAMRKLHYNGRHLKIMFINIAQYTMDIPKALRGQIDYVFALREPNTEYRINLWKNFFGIFSNYEDFSLAMSVCTSNNCCLVIDNTSKSNDISEVVFWYKASLKHRPFMIGNRNFWKQHYMLYNPPSLEYNDDVPIPAFAPKNPPAPRPKPAQSEESVMRRSKKKSADMVIIVEKKDVDGGVILSVEDEPTKDKHVRPSKASSDRYSLPKKKRSEGA